MSRRPTDPTRPLPEGAAQLLEPALEIPAARAGLEDPTDERSRLLHSVAIEPGAWEMDSLDADTVEIPVLDMPEVSGPEMPEIGGHARKKPEDS